MDISDLPRIPSREFMGGEVVSLAHGGERAVVRFVPPEGMTNPHGTVQGGFVAAMIDDAVSLATYFAGGERLFVTTNLNCYYLNPVPAGVPLLVRCDLVKAGKRQAIFDATVTVQGSDTVLVKAVQTQQYLS